jgi:predicted homoserine dehydrogenase-like protein
VEFVRKLRQREADGNPIRVGIVGCGQMGSGLAHSINNVVGMTVAAVADTEPERGVATFTGMGWSRDDIVLTDTLGPAQDALVAGRAVVTADALLMPQLESVDANVEATGVPDVGAHVAWLSVMNGKPIIMLNVETDVTVGAILSRLALKAGSIYTVASGDEPGVCKMLYEQATLMGFEVVCLGKGKNNPLNLGATPDSARQEALSKGMNPKILAAFQDGTKTMIEMAAVSNATGLLPDVPGMHGPEAEVEDLARVFVPKEDGGIFSRRGTVDYSTGKVAPGVFAIVYAADARMRKDMQFITHAEGPYYLHYRPYHLCDLETPQSVAEAVLFGERTIASDAINSEVVAVAKRDLKAGWKVKGIGGEDWYGTIVTAEDARTQEAVPIGVAAGGTVTTDVRKGELLTRQSFAPDQDTFVYRLRRMQDALLAGESEGPPR